MVMGIFTGSLNINKVASDIKDGFDKATLTMQEKAEGTVTMMERLGITPSSKTRRLVTYIQLGFIMTLLLWGAGVFHVDPEWSKFILSLVVAYSTNAVVLTINAFFYGGYYLSKQVTAKQSIRLEEKKLNLDIKKKEADIEIAKENIKLERKRTRFLRKHR